MVFGEISEMFLFLSVAGGSSLCLIDSSWQAELWQGNERESKQTCTVAYKP